MYFGILRIIQLQVEWNVGLSGVIEIVSVLSSPTHHLLPPPIYLQVFHAVNVYIEPRHRVCSPFVFHCLKIEEPCGTAPIKKKIIKCVFLLDHPIYNQFLTLQVSQ
jgi:hypothetical protein